MNNSVYNAYKFIQMHLLFTSFHPAMNQNIFVYFDNIIFAYNLQTSAESPTSPDDKPSLTRKASTISNSSGTITPDVSRKSLSGLSRKSSLAWNCRYLMSSCFVLRLEDIVAYKVSTATSSRKRPLERFLVYNKSVHKPSDIKTLHLEQTSYYLPGEIDFPGKFFNPIYSNQ